MSVNPKAVHRRRKRLTKAERTKMIIIGSAFTAMVVMMVLTVITAIFAHIRSKAYDVTPLTNDVILKANIANAEKLMIVAHPDDETLWGGGHLINESGYLVVCITNGRNETRSEEFVKAVKASGNAPLILEYPDKVNGERDNWNEVYKSIQNDMDLLIGYKKWKQIVTHNPDGEYGHIHHQMTSNIVTQSCEKAGYTDKLWYFGKYYKKTDLPKHTSEMTQLDSNTYELKKKMMEYYSSQKNTLEKLGHMAPYEEWRKAYAASDTETAEQSR